MDSSKAQIASERFAEGYNCAQAVMFAFSEDCGLSPDLALKAACGFGGGMGRKQEVCGAVTGAILVLSLRQGRGIQEGPAVTQDTYKSVREFMDAFAARNGSCICLDLLSGCDVSGAVQHLIRRNPIEDQGNRDLSVNSTRHAYQVFLGEVHIPHLAPSSSGGLRGLRVNSPRVTDRLRTDLRSLARRGQWRHGILRRRQREAHHRQDDLLRLAGDLGNDTVAAAGCGDLQRRGSGYPLGGEREGFCQRDLLGDVRSGGLGRRAGIAGKCPE